MRTELLASIFIPKDYKLETKTNELVNGDVSVHVYQITKKGRVKLGKIVYPKNFIEGRHRVQLEAIREHSEKVKKLTFTNPKNALEYLMRFCFVSNRSKTNGREVILIKR